MAGNSVADAILNFKFRFLDNKHGMVYSTLNEFYCSREKV